MRLPDTNQQTGKAKPTGYTKVVDKQQWTAMVKDVLSNSNIKRREHEKLEKYQELKEEREKMWRVKATVLSVVTGTLAAVTPKLGEWL